MKRILALVLAAMMLLSMAACAASTPAAAEAAADTNTEAPLLEQLRELTRGSAQVAVSDPFYAPF